MIGEIISFVILGNIRQFRNSHRIVVRFGSKDAP
jgi:hypothetical protein